MNQSVKIGKKELLAQLAENLDMSRTEAEFILEGTFNTIADLLAEGKTVSIPRFGKFTVYQSAPRTGRNPATGESVEVPAKQKMKFKPSNKLKDLIQE